MPAKENLSPFKAKKTRILSRKKVCKMLAVMESQQQQQAGSSSSNSPIRTDEFLATGRTGRRNALPDILGEHALVTTSDLPNKLQSLTTSEEQGTSNESNAESNTKPNS